MSDDNLVILPMPALVAVLLNREQAKGSPLTESEVLEIRDNAVCTMVPRDIVAKIVETRGYDDVRPEHVWEDWSAVRQTLTTQD